MMIHFESDYVNATIIICLQLNRRLTPRARDVIGAFIVRYGSRIWILDSVHILSVDYLDTTSRAVSSVIISGVHSKHSVMMSTTTSIVHVSRVFPPSSPRYYNTTLRPSSPNCLASSAQVF